MSHALTETLSGFASFNLGPKIQRGIEETRKALKRRGVIVSAGALVVGLGSGAAEAVPRSLVHALGRMSVAGGTGGHIFPALAVAERLRDGGIPLVWLGSKRGLEARIVPQAGIELVKIAISGLRGTGGDL